MRLLVIVAPGSCARSPGASCSQARRVGTPWCLSSPWGKGYKRRNVPSGLVFSQDQDLSEVAEEVRVISREQGRWLKIACAFPVSPTSRNRRGIDKTDWIRIDRATYDACLDRRDYRPKGPATGGVA